VKENWFTGQGRARPGCQGEHHVTPSPGPLRFSFSRQRSSGGGAARQRGRRSEPDTAWGKLWRRARPDGRQADADGSLARSPPRGRCRARARSQCATRTCGGGAGRAASSDGTGRGGEESAVPSRTGSAGRARRSTVPVRPRRGFPGAVKAGRPGRPWTVHGCVRGGLFRALCGGSGSGSEWAY